MVAYDTLTWLGAAQPSTYALVWNAAYLLTVSSLVAASMTASARLAELDGRAAGGLLGDG
jgi:hypothetical protein